MNITSQDSIKYAIKDLETTVKRLKELQAFIETGQVTEIVRLWSLPDESLFSLHMKVEKTLREKIQKQKRETIKGPAKIVYIDYKNKISFDALSPYDSYTGQFLCWDIGIYD